MQGRQWKVQCVGFVNAYLFNPNECTLEKGPRGQDKHLQRLLGHPLAETSLRNFSVSQRKVMRSLQIRFSKFSPDHL